MLRFYWRQLFWLWLSAALIVVDQLTKKVALFYLSAGNSKTILPVFDFCLAFNRGAAFSFLNSASGWQNIFFTSLAIVFSLLMVIAIFCHAHAPQNASIALIIGGALGNVMDRFNYGYVIDFIDLHLGAYHWPIFNLADSAICMGVFGLIVVHFFKSTPSVQSG